MKWYFFRTSNEYTHRIPHTENSMTLYHLPLNSLLWIVVYTYLPRVLCTGHHRVKVNLVKKEPTER